MKKFFAGLFVVMMTALFGCGGSGGGSSVVTNNSLTGTASQGAPLAVGTVVTLKDSKGAKVTSNVKANGTYSVVVDGLTAPYILNAGGFYSFATASGVTNINPLTHLSMQIVLGTSAISDSTTIPVNIQTQLTSVVTDLKAKIDGLYPSTVAATQKDFFNGDIVIDGGVDKVFASLAITAPDATGYFSASINGQQIISGMKSNGVVTITPKATAISSASTIVFPSTAPTTGFTYPSIAGKTVYAATTNGGYGVYSFNTNGTGTYTSVLPSPAAPIQLTWEYSVSSATTQSYKITLSGRGTNSYYPTPASSASSIIMASLYPIISEHWYIGSTAQADALAYFYAGTTPTPVTAIFTTTTVTGHTLTYMMTSGTAVYTFSATGNTYTVTGKGAGSGTWLIDTAGKLILNATSYPAGTSYPSIFRIVSANGNNLTVQAAHNDTPTTWEPATSNGVNLVIQ